MFDGSFRGPVDRILGPVGRFLHRLGVSPDLITASGALLAGACGYVIATGNLRWGAALLAAASIPDALDGAVAKAGGLSSDRGAFLDSVTDRLSDGLVFSGIAWYYLRGDDPELALLPIALMLSSSLVSYMRAKAESLGYDAKGGLMERAERLIAVGAALIFRPFFTAILAVILALTAATAIFRFAKVWAQASAASTPAPVDSAR